MLADLPVTFTSVAKAIGRPLFDPMHLLANVEYWASDKVTMAGKDEADLGGGVTALYFKPTR